jgi:hypothetical protein
MDKLEKYIRTHRKEFETAFPAKQEIWNDVEKHISPTKKIPLWKNPRIQFSAAAILIAIISIFLLNRLTEKNDNTICSVKGVSREFCLVVNEYETDIQQKLISISSANLSIPEEIEGEITIDSPMKAMLLEELKRNPENPKIKDAIVKYYQAKLELIQRIEEVLKKQQKSIYNETAINPVI